MRAISFTMLRGFLMGCADIVPGVSGGTVALVLGIYSRLVSSVRAGSSAVGRLLRGDLQSARARLGEVEWTFVISLGAGIVLAIAALSHLLETLLEDHSVAMAGLFFGLVAGSVAVTLRLVRRRDGVRLALGVAAAALTFILLGLRESTSTEGVGDASDHALAVFFVAGAIAICAMILPGVSGSFLLVMMGMYGSVLAAVNDRDLVVLAVFVAGCVVGLGLFSQLLHWALAKHYDSVMAILIGLMVGSTRVLWPWPDGVDSTALHAPSGSVPVAAALAAGAFVVVVVFDLVARRLEQRTVADEADELRHV